MATSVKKQVIFTTSCMVAPAAVAMARMFAITCRVWASQSPTPTRLPLLSLATFPEMNRKSPALMPGERAGLGADSLGSDGRSLGHVHYLRIKGSAVG